MKPKNSTGYTSFKLRSKSVISTCISLFSLTVFFLLWLVISTYTQLGQYFLPSPIAVVNTLADNLTDTQIWVYILNTVVEAVLGSLLGAVVALVLAFTVFKTKYLGYALHPFIGASQSIPAIAIAPLLLLWIGYGLASIVILCTLMVFFPIFIATLTGLKSMDKQVLEASILDGASGFTLIRYIEFPLVLNSFISGLRNGFTLSITGAVVGEVVMGGNGLGTLLTIQRNNLDVVGMFSTIAMLSILSVSVYAVLLLVEKTNKTISDVIA